MSGDCSASESETHSCFLNPAGYIQSHRWIFDGISPTTIDYIERYQHGSVDRLPGDNDCFYSSTGVTPLSVRTSSTRRTSCSGSYDDTFTDRFTGSSVCSSDCTDYKAGTSGSMRKAASPGGCSSSAGGSSSTPRLQKIGNGDSIGSMAAAAGGATAAATPVLASGHLRKLKTGKPSLSAVPAAYVQAYGDKAADKVLAQSLSMSTSASASPSYTKPSKSRLGRLFCLGL